LCYKCATGKVGAAGAGDTGDHLVLEAEVAGGRAEMGTMSVRPPEALHEKARVLEKREGVAINQLVTTALAKKRSAFRTEDCLEERSRRGSRRKFDEALLKVQDRDPDPGGEL
jgi:hypothetical protein